MGNQVRLVIAIVSLALLVSLTLIQQAMSTGRLSLMTITRKGIREQKMVPVKQHRERVDEAVVMYHTGDQHIREIDQHSSYQHRIVRQVEVDASKSEDRASRVSFTHRKLNPEFHSNRQIPGGPDGQHHDTDG